MFNGHSGVAPNGTFRCSEGLQALVAGSQNDFFPETLNGNNQLLVVEWDIQMLSGSSEVEQDGTFRSSMGTHKLDRMCYLVVQCAFRRWTEWDIQVFSRNSGVGRWLSK